MSVPQARGVEGLRAAPQEEPGGAGLRRHASLWSTLVKLRLTSLITLGTLGGALLGAREGDGFGRALEAALWITLSAAGGAILNQVIEREVDGRMARTAGRPLPTGAVSARLAGLVGVLLGVVAALGLALRFNLFAALLSFGTLLVYVCVYTPLKRVTGANTVVGAVAGAAPAAIGYVALDGAFGTWAQVLFAVIFAWQFPHFMAIAWIYREDYRRAGMAMVPAMPEAEGATALLSTGACLALVPVVLLPTLHGDAGLVYAFSALFLSLAFSAYAVRFAQRQDEPRARALFVASIVYLPAWLLAILVDALVERTPNAF